MTAKSGSASCLASGEGQQAEGNDQPDDQREQRSRRSLQPCANEEMADDDAVDRERDRARRHRTALQSCVVSTVPVQGDAERSKRDGGRRCEKAGEAIGTQNVTEDGEGRYNDASNEKADDVLGHFAFFQSFDSGPPFP